jgi:hypothetical protein
MADWQSAGWGVQVTRLLAFLSILAIWNCSDAQQRSMGGSVEIDPDVLPDFNGVWLVAPGTIGGIEFAEMGSSEPPRLTEQALRIGETYDHLVDDPGYRCSPSSITRVWSNPNPVEIEQRSDQVMLRYEYMDGFRVVDMDTAGDSMRTPPEILGYSVGRYEGSTLIIESTGFAPSYIGVISGTPQTETLKITERLTLSEDGQRFRLDIVHEDPATFTAPWTPTREFVRTDLDRLEWNCVLEDAGYEEFNAP